MSDYEDFVNHVQRLNDEVRERIRIAGVDSIIHLERNALRESCAHCMHPPSAHVGEIMQCIMQPTTYTKLSDDRLHLLEVMWMTRLV